MYRKALSTTFDLPFSGLSPHPEERRLRRVSKDEATVEASWFETAQGRLLTMRADNYQLRSPLAALKPHPEERRLRRVSKDEATVEASWFETAQGRLLAMRADNYTFDLPPRRSQTSS
jgi:hypothetical protein